MLAADDEEADKLQFSGVDVCLKSCCILSKHPVYDVTLGLRRTGIISGCC